MPKVMTIWFAIPLEYPVTEPKAAVKVKLSPALAFVKSWMGTVQLKLEQFYRMVPKGGRDVYDTSDHARDLSAVGRAGAGGWQTANHRGIPWAEARAEASPFSRRALRGLRGPGDRLGGRRI